MKCLSVKNPLGYLICAGIKDVENRSWSTDYRGRIYIHSSGSDNYKILVNSDFPKSIQKELNKVKYYDEIADMSNVKNCRDIVARVIDLTILANKSDHPFYKSKCIIGHVDLIDVIKNSDSRFAEKGLFHWIFKSPVLYENPILHVLGKLKFFEYGFNVPEKFINFEEA